MSTEDFLFVDVHKLNLLTPRFRLKVLDMYKQIELFIYDIN